MTGVQTCALPIWKLDELNITPRSERQDDANRDSSSEGMPLSGLTFVLTGSLSIDRTAFSRRIVAAGGKVASSVTSNTSYLLAGTGGGSKRAKAEKLGIPIISEADIEEMIHRAEQAADIATEVLFTLEG